MHLSKEIELSKHLKIKKLQSNEVIHIVPHCALILIDRLIDKNKNYLRDIPSFRLRTFFEMRYFLIYQCQLKRNLKYQFDVINVLSG